MGDSSKTQKKIAVTGAAGFIGSRLAQKLYARGKTNLLLIDDAELFSTRSCCNAYRGFQGIKYQTPSDFLVFLEKGSHDLEAVYHMGACSRTDETRESYLDENNTGYTKRLWSSCVKQKVPFYYASSASTDGAGEHGYSDDPKKIPLFKPLNLYGWSKQKFDLWLTQQEQHPPHWAGWKFFNVYGPGENHKGSQASVFLGAFRQLQKNGRLKLFRSHKEGIPDGEQKRDFVFVDDAVNVMIEFAEKGLNPGIYNLGTGQARSFLDLAKAAAQALQIPLHIDWVDTPEHLRAHYQYFTEASLENLRSAGIEHSFKNLEEGAKLYLSEWSDSEI